MKTTNEQFDFISLGNFVRKSHGGLHFKLCELEIIELLIADDQYILTDIALFYNLGEIKTMEIRKGVEVLNNFYNVEEVIQILNYNMPLSQLYEAMYPDDEEQYAFDAETDDYTYDDEIDSYDDEQDFNHYEKKDYQTVESRSKKVTLNILGYGCWE